MLRQGYRRVISIYLIISLLIPMGPTYASMISSAEYLGSIESSNFSKPHRLDEMLSSPALRDRLVALGVNESVVDERIKTLSADERVYLERHIDELPAGGDVLGLLVFLFIVFVITDALGVTDIFPFVHPMGSAKK